jgi:hypothetical protein
MFTAARRWDTPGAIGQALRARGLIEGGERGLALLRDAVEHLERSPRASSTRLSKLDERNPRFEMSSPAWAVGTWAL